MVARAPCLVAAFAALTIPPPALAGGGPRVSGREIVRQAALGLPVTIPRHAVVTGPVRLPLQVRGPIVLEDATFLAPVIARSTAFGNRVSFAGSTLRRGADFTGASFEGPASFDRLTARAPVAFDEATFQGPARFGAGAHFQAPASFDSASFRDGADFTAATFDRRASFEAAEFGDVANFAAATFNGPASFDAARFSGEADFSSQTFADAVSFARARFEQGASYRNREFDHGPVFDSSQSGGDLVFDGALLMAGASFSTVRFLGSTTFSQSDLSHFLNFDQAVLQKLDLDGAIFEPNAWILLPTGAGTTGHVDELRFDPSDARHFTSGDQAALVQDRKCAADPEKCAEGQPNAEHSLRLAAEQALLLAERAAHRGGDIGAENRAYAVRESLARHDEPMPERVLNYVFFWGVAGYFVSPLHQVATLALLLLLFTAAQWSWGKTQSPPVGAGASFRESWRLLWRLDVRQGTFVQSIEAIAFKVVFVLLLMNLANVWPPVHDLLRGVLL